MCVSECVFCFCRDRARERNGVKSDGSQPSVVPWRDLTMCYHSILRCLVCADVASYVPDKMRVTYAFVALLRKRQVFERYLRETDMLVLRRQRAVGVLSSRLCAVGCSTQSCRHPCGFVLTLTIMHYRARHPFGAIGMLVAT